MQKAYSIFIVISVLISCSRDSKEDKPESFVTTEWTAMSNPTDPMFAVAKTDTSKIEFYGDRDGGGIPSKLKLFIVKTKTDTIFYYIDDVGRPLVIQNTNGVQFKYVWKNAKQADLTVISKDGLYIINAPVNLGRENNPNIIPVQQPPILLGASGTLGPDNLTVKVIKCNTPTNANIGDVGIELRTVQGSQEKEVIPAYYVNGRYVASLPKEFSTSLNPSPEVCDKIKDVLEIVCNVSGAPAMDLIMVATCSAMSAALVSSGIAAVAAAVFYDACLKAIIGLDIYCKTIQASAVPGAPGIVDVLCNAKYIKRVYNQGIYLQPYIFSKGTKVMGDLLSTIGGSQSIELKLDLGCVVDTFNYTARYSVPGTIVNNTIKLNLHFENGVISGRGLITNYPLWGIVTGSFSGTDMTLNFIYDNGVTPTCNFIPQPPPACPSCVLQQFIGGSYGIKENWVIIGSTDNTHSTFNAKYVRNLTFTQLIGNADCSYTTNIQRPVENGIFNY
jgi:hypothetical protein